MWSTKSSAIWFSGLLFDLDTHVRDLLFLGTVPDFPLSRWHFCIITGVSHQLIYDVHPLKVTIPYIENPHPLLEDTAIFLFPPRVLHNVCQLADSQ